MSSRKKSTRTRRPKQRDVQRRKNKTLFNEALDWLIPKNALSTKDRFHGNIKWSPEQLTNYLPFRVWALFSGAIMGAAHPVSRSVFVDSQPSMAGICMSIRMTSKGLPSSHAVTARSRASCPFSATVTSAPAFFTTRESPARSTPARERKSRGTPEAETLSLARFRPEAPRRERGKAGVLARPSVP